MERLKTGIEGLDELMQGGIPAASTVLISGGAGCGKTILGMQYIYNGASQFNEPGVYVALEANVKNIVWNMESFNWDIKKLQGKNLMRVYRLNLGYEKDPDKMLDKINAELKVITDLVEEIQAKRLVIDSVAAFGMWFESSARLRSTLFNFVDKLKELNCTTLMTTETSGGREDYSSFGVEDFVADGVIALYFSPPNRSVFVKKMRGTNQSKSVHPFEITSTGIKVHSKDTIMWESIK